jgi:septum formation protein
MVTQAAPAVQKAPLRIILASQSPRRRWLLESAGFEVDVRPVAVEEARRPGEAPVDMVERLARAKATALKDPGDLPVVAADTVVALADEVLGKPRDERQAARTLRRLSGEEHVVLTGWCVRFRDGARVGVVRTQVWFRDLSDGEIERYIATGEPMDKAGAYGIQGDGGALVDRVAGSYTNVVGLPLAEVIWELRDIELIP